MSRFGYTSVIGDEICAGCGKPIAFNEPGYYRKNPGDDIGQSFHSACGDPLGIKAAVVAERERCAKIAQDWPAQFVTCSPQARYAAENIAAEIRVIPSQQRGAKS